MSDNTSVVLITGPSGSGKTTVLHALEDMGWFCMDNLPVVLLPKVIELASPQKPRIAVVVDAREPQYIAQAPHVLAQLEASGTGTQVLFLDASDATLIQRFSETRRRHPLAHGSISLADAFKQERLLLDELQQHACTIRTDGLTVHDLKRDIQSRFSSSDTKSMNIRTTSFGFKHGQISPADLVFDVRFVSNPFFIPELKPLCGLDEACAEYVIQREETQEFIGHLMPMLHALIPRYRAEGKAYLTIAFGCTGGRHRSVAISEYVGALLKEGDGEVEILHRDRGHWPPTSGIGK
jgi:UPF0042 nucleotide-binding protein